jgi:hypothetical protein
MKKDQKPTNAYATLWMALQTMSLTLFIIKGHEYAWVSLKSDDTRIMGVLFGIFLMFLVKNIHDFWGMKKEQKALEALDNLKWSDEKGVDQLKTAGEIPTGMVGDTLELLNLRLRHQHLQDLDLEELHSRWSWEVEKKYELMKHGSNVLVTLGLIGTVAGLIITIGGLEGVMLNVDSGQGTEGLLSGISQTLGGMSTAFYTTLFGAILGGAFLKTAGLFVYNASVNGMMHSADLLEKTLLAKAQARWDKKEDPNYAKKENLLLRRLDRLIRVLEKSHDS